MDDHEEKEYFENLINDLKHHHNDDNDSDNVPDNSDGDDDILGSWEQKYATMDEEKVMIVTYDNIYEEGDTSDHEYGSNESEEEKIDGDSEV